MLKFSKEISLQIAAGLHAISTTAKVFSHQQTFNFENIGRTCVCIRCASPVDEVQISKFQLRR